MTKILFICWGNICRSPSAEYLFRELARREGRENDFLTASAGVSDEEEGQGVHPEMRKLLSARGIDCSAHRARKLRAEDYDNFDLLICMDEMTIGRARRLFFGDEERKIRNLLDFAGRKGEEIDDPWYTREFDRAMREIEIGCRGLLESLSDPVMTLDFSACADREELYKLMRGKMHWQGWYGSNLDALWDILTGLEYEGRSFRIVLPPEESELYSYARLVRETFREAGKLEEEKEEE